MLDPLIDYSISDELFDEIFDAIESLPVNSFYPPSARDANLPYVERFCGAGETWLYNVFNADGLPVAAALEHSWLATDNYIQAAFEN